MRISRVGSCFPRGEEFGGTKVEQSRGGFEFSLGFVHGINAIGSPPALGSLPTRKNPNYPEYRSTSAGAFYDPELIRCKIPEKKKPNNKKKSLEGQSGDGKKAISRFFPARGEEFTKNRGIGRKYFDFSARFEAPGEARRGFGVISRRNGIFLWFDPGGLGRKMRILGLFFPPPGPNLAEWRGNKGEGSSKNWSEGGKLN